MFQSKDVINSKIGSGTPVFLYIFTDVQRILPPEHLNPDAFSDLSPQDMSAAGRIVRASAARDFLRRRICLFRGLSHFLDLHGDHPFSAYEGIGIGEHGKPFLLHPESGNFTGFNLSARSDSVIIGITRRGDIGVDLEDSNQHIKNRSLDAVMEYYYRDNEKVFVNSGSRHSRFIELWTIKEAAVKAVGLSIGSHGMVVDGLADQWLAHGGMEIRGCCFSLHDHPAMIASIAIPGEGPFLQSRIIALNANSLLTTPGQSSPYPGQNKAGELPAAGIDFIELS